MIKKLSKMFIMAMLCVMVFSSTVMAADQSYTFTLCNTGKEYRNKSNNTNTKVYINDNWTLRVNKITCAGGYGISFCPGKYLSSSQKYKVCSGSSVWRRITGSVSVSYKSGDNALTKYKLYARQDDDYYSTFSATGKFNADNTLN